MKTPLSVASASVLCIALGGSALAEDPAAKKPIVIKDELTTKAKVIAINHETRDVTLEGAKGEIIALNVSEDVKRFDTMKVGDVVTAHYYESVAYDIKKPGTKAAPDTVTEQSGKLTGAKPGGGMTDVNVTTVTVTAIDAAKPSITIRGSDGQVQTIKVRYPEYLKEVKVGDVVVVTKTEAMMVSVE
jgi:hypothetical protein